MASFGLGNASAEPEIHCRRRKEQGGERGVPRAVENVARDHEKIFPRVPRTHAPIGSEDDCKKDDEGERIEKHVRRDSLSKKACWWPVHFADHFAGLILISRQGQDRAGD